MSSPLSATLHRLLQIAAVAAALRFLPIRQLYFLLQLILDPLVDCSFRSLPIDLLKSSRLAFVIPRLVKQNLILASRLHIVKHPSFDAANEYPSLLICPEKNYLCGKRFVPLSSRIDIGSLSTMIRLMIYAMQTLILLLGLIWKEICPRMQFSSANASSLSYRPIYVWMGRSRCIDGHA